MIACKDEVNSSHTQFLGYYRISNSGVRLSVMSTWFFMEQERRMGALESQWSNKTFYILAV